MKSLLFALGLALCCVVQAEWKEMTTCRKQDMGRWVSSVIACNSPDYLGQISEMTAFVADLSSPQEDVFSISALIP
ncbi:extracellular fatty acid-binding protein-like, partial [Notechis scutatus]|uniref:Extracellular fatty acid-binding protein-like n=1 Tax=Notechis scutatus TaxID=8663 RepID=A0A6J1W4Y9_9SAUR